MDATVTIKISVPELDTLRMACAEAQASFHERQNSSTIASERDKLRKCEAQVADLVRKMAV